MTTIKSFTDIEQSKKLAEILPLESADMFYADLFDDNKHQYIVHPLESYGFKTFKDTNGKTSRKLNFIPCWSLAVLLDIIPKHIKDYNVLRIDISEKDFAIWYDEVGFGVNNNLPDITADNPVDACYEFVLKLNKIKML